MIAAELFYLQTSNKHQLTLVVSHEYVFGPDLFVGVLSDSCLNALLSDAEIA